MPAISVRTVKGVLEGVKSASRRAHRSSNGYILKAVEIQLKADNIVVCDACMGHGDDVTQGGDPDHPDACDVCGGAGYVSVRGRGSK